MATFGAVLVALGVLTFRQTRIWHDSMTFWAYTARVNPYAFIAHQALGLMSRDTRPDEALRELLLARRLRPDIAVVHANIGGLLARRHRYAAAAGEYRKAVALRPDSADYEQRLGEVLLQQQRPVRASLHLERAVALRPASAEARRALEAALAARRPADGG